MKKSIPILVTVLLAFLLANCSTENPVFENKPIMPNSQNTTNAAAETIPMVKTLNHTINYLALGDSYTVGQSVCSDCKFPEQLQKSLKNTNTANSYSLKVIAQTGWTTTNLISGINNQNLSPNYDLVSLLIGVNNQYQNKAFSLYEKEFPELLNKSIAFAKGDKNKVIVVSIPDYAYTPYGQGSGNQSKISTEIDNYNAYAKKYCEENAVAFINITDITRKGLMNPELLAQDGLHPSEKAYALFVERIAPVAARILNK
ncbi:MAG TPA: SGNH/GDSL hydrolase family protein [Flavobacterium sp.]|uniref:SGNH/GDSL hydrolase family protein n=1 Tax=Flavobacterium sp. TaxID=239 RepID=UPI002F40B5D9